MAQNFAVSRPIFLQQGRQRTSRTMQRIGALVMVFVQLKVGQGLLPGPTGIAHQLGPAVVVARLATHVNHAVDAAAAAKRFATRVAQCTAV